jgi:hypothetical protein
MGDWWTTQSTISDDHAGRNENLNFGVWKNPREQVRMLVLA